MLDVRLRRFNHPVEVRPAVFDLIRSERKQVAERLRAEGEAQYQILKSQADRERDAILAKAEAEAERIRGRGDAEATRILNEAHARDPKFYEFVRTLETYRAILDDRATLVLSSASPLLRLLTQGPSEDLLREEPAAPGRQGRLADRGPSHEAARRSGRSASAWSLALAVSLERAGRRSTRARWSWSAAWAGSCPSPGARAPLGLAAGDRPGDPAPARRGPPARIRPVEAAGPLDDRRARAST